MAEVEETWSRAKFIIHQYVKGNRKSYILGPVDEIIQVGNVQFFTFFFMNKESIFDQSEAFQFKKMVSIYPIATITQSQISFHSPHFTSLRWTSRQAVLFCGLVSFSYLNPILQALDDTSMNLQNMSASRYIGPFLPVVNRWEKSLSMISEVLDVSQSFFPKKK